MNIYFKLIRYLENYRERFNENWLLRIVFLEDYELYLSLDYFKLLNKVINLIIM